MNKDEKLQTLKTVMDIENDNDIVTSIIEHLGNIQVQDVTQLGKNQYEVLMKPHAFTGKELKDMETFFEIKEIGILGDPEIPEESIYFHMIVNVKRF